MHAMFLFQKRTNELRWKPPQKLTIFVFLPSNTSHLSHRLDQHEVKVWLLNFYPVLKMSKILFLKKSIRNKCLVSVKPRQ